MIESSVQNKKAWEYSAYDFWIKQNGTPQELAEKILENPKVHLRKYAKYFDFFEDIKVANICGSCGKKAIPLALLGADVTVFDNSKVQLEKDEFVAKRDNLKINF